MKVGGGGWVGQGRVMKGKMGTSVIEQQQKRKKNKDNVRKSKGKRQKISGDDAG